jgi:uncharacterized membrane protein
MIDASPKKVVQFVYVLFALSFFFPPLAIAGVIVCFLKRYETNDPLVRNHIEWQIQSFWWMTLGMLVGLITTFMFIGWLVMTGTAIWFLYRTIKGWLAYAENTPVGLAPIH